MNDEATSPAQPEKRNDTVVNQWKSTDNLKQFKKGDKRINRKGRPKTFDKLRAMVVDVLNEELNSDGESTTRLRLMLNGMTTGGNPADHRLLLEYGFGKVKDEVDVKFESMTTEQLQAHLAAILTGKSDAK